MVSLRSDMLSLVGGAGGSAEIDVLGVEVRGEDGEGLWGGEAVGDDGEGGGSCVRVVGVQLGELDGLGVNIGWHGNKSYFNEDLLPRHLSDCAPSPPPGDPSNPETPVNYIPRITFDNHCLHLAKAADIYVGKVGQTIDLGSGALGVIKECVIQPDEVKNYCPWICTPPHLTFARFTAPFSPFDPQAHGMGDPCQILRPGDLWLSIEEGHRGIWVLGFDRSWILWDQLDPLHLITHPVADAYLLLGTGKDLDNLGWWGHKVCGNSKASFQARIQSANWKSGAHVADHLALVLQAPSKPRKGGRKCKLSHSTTTDISESPLSNTSGGVDIAQWQGSVISGLLSEVATLPPQSVHGDADHLTSMFQSFSLTERQEGIEFPCGSEKIKWMNGMESFLPWIRPPSGEGEDVMAVKKMAAAPDGKVDPSIDSWDIREFCEDPLNPSIPEAKVVIERIKCNISKGRPTLVRGCQLVGPRFTFDEGAAKLYKGSLHNPISVQEAGRRLQSELSGSEGPPDVHMSLSLENFIQEATRPDLPGKPKISAPWFLNQQEEALYLNRQDEHALCLPDRNPRQRKDDADGFSGAQLMDPDMSRLGQWDLLTHGGFMTQTHHDAAGACTWMSIQDGCKFWTLVYIKSNALSSREHAKERFIDATGALKDQMDNNSDIKLVTICLEPGDILIQPPAIMHAIYTPVKTVATGGHFFLYDAMHLTEISMDIDHDHSDVTTNQVHHGAHHLLVNMTLALPNMWDKPMARKPFLTLARLILRPKDYAPDLKGLGKPTMYKEERVECEVVGEISDAQKIIRAVMKENSIAQEEVLARHPRGDPLEPDFYDPGEVMAILHQE
ncbi:hypothetical protein NEOLEDRAFT_1151755 [Neolentinus lepideus HHB14362 ss-1]|uniref:JmjC domain-containing protein n=1 Tax=Neolentinus lepideus HHB14362 ss-1 TaxID=1314782 RepID=A0A165NKL7_9AGAM|nr:hypothetical protein NEOLEDRAFT_1151755 [Neolentinus lepideus HHB14362 ss-1]